ncbi:MAG: tryptophan--tRNA ligase [bacterium]|nr:tryptophan--tRNA ligase [bacterium]
MKQPITILSGMQPTGPLHLGNYLGALRNFVHLQKEYSGQCFFMVADYHSLTEDFDPEQKQQQVLELAAEFLAAGLDPKKSTLYVQSDVPEVTELCWIFNSITPISFLDRMTQFKDKSARQAKNINMGLYDYPVLQAADILLPRANRVPVGQDQVQHVELTRDIAGFFNRKFGHTFEEPQPLLTEIPKVMSLLDPEKKMSKSAPGSFVAISDEPEVIHEKLRRAVTDTGPVTNRSVKSAGVQNLFTLLAQFGTREDVERFEELYENGTIRYSDVKELLGTRIADHFAEFRANRAALLAHPATIKKALRDGAKKMKKVAAATMKEVRKKVGLE